MNIGLIDKKDNIDRSQEISEIVDIIIRNGASAFYYDNKLNIRNATLLLEQDFYNSIDMIFVLGGDGTILQAAEKSVEKDIPILGINFGRIGYLTDLEKKDVQLIDKIFTGDYIIDARMMLKGDISYGGTIIHSFDALNDIVISRGLSPRMIELELYIDDVLFTHFRADGVVFSTPTGSTAYSLSAGGTVIDPASELIAITPICPHTLKSRPLIIHKDRKLRLSHIDKTGDFSYISFDGKEAVPIKQNLNIDIRISDKKAKLVRILNRNFYSVLKEKV